MKSCLHERAHVYHTGYLILSHWLFKFPQHDGELKNNSKPTHYQKCNIPYYEHCICHFIISPTLLVICFLVTKEDILNAWGFVTMRIRLSEKLTYAFGIRLSIIKFIWSGLGLKNNCTDQVLASDGPNAVTTTFLVTVKWVQRCSHLKQVISDTNSFKSLRRLCEIRCRSHSIRKIFWGCKIILIVKK